jgi:hypothetical protein
MKRMNKMFIRDALFRFQIIREKIRPQDVKLSDLAQSVKMGHLQIGNKIM